MSDDGRHGLTVIAFVGSVFSPYYAAARRRAPGGAADPLGHCAVNVALYEPERSWWSMTERARGSLARGPGCLRIGPSQLVLAPEGLRLELDECAVPWPARLRGTVTLAVPAWRTTAHALDAAGLHRWTPLAPRARVAVEMTSPALRWQGEGYLDRNQGDRALEQDIRHWHWSRAHLPGGRSAVLYDTVAHDGRATSLALEFDAGVASRPIAALPAAPLPSSRWGVAREGRSDAGSVARVRRSLEDGPFYARSLVEASWHGEPVLAMHESLSMQRFSRRWVQALLPFRMPRRG